MVAIPHGWLIDLCLTLPGGAKVAGRPGPGRPSALALQERQATLAQETKRMKEFVIKTPSSHRRRLFSAKVRAVDVETVDQILGFVCNTLALLPLPGANLRRRDVELTFVLAI